MKRRNLVAGTAASTIALVVGKAAEAAPEEGTTVYASETTIEAWDEVAAQTNARNIMAAFHGLSYATATTGPDGEIAFPDDMPAPSGDAVVLGYEWVFPSGDGMIPQHFTTVRPERFDAWVAHNFFGGPGRLVRVYFI